MLLEILATPMPKYVSPCLTPYPTINKKYIMDLNIKTIKLIHLEGNRRKSL
jgi:hypothetical protein